MRRVVAVVLFTVVACGSLLAQNSEQYRMCIKEANTQTKMRSCAREEAIRVDAELNRIYQGLLRVVGNEAAAVEKIRAAEDAWIAYRDAYLDAMYSAKDKQAAYGSIFPMEADLLRVKLTKRQIEALTDLVKRYTDSRQ